MSLLDLVKIANQLDSIGKYKEASEIDEVLKEAGLKDLGLGLSLMSLFNSPLAYEDAPVEVKQEIKQQKVPEKKEKEKKEKEKKEKDTRPRGIRNNNPGNIESTKTQWEGATKGEDSKFITFKDPESGIRAMARNLRSYQRKYKLNTVEKIIARWAPSFENNTKDYIDHICRSMSIKPDTKLNLEDDKTCANLIQYMITMENGRKAIKYYTPKVILRGVQQERSQSESPKKKDSKT